MAKERGVAMIDNRAVEVACYAPTHTFVEKLQTISSKYRKLKEAEAFPANFLRHYYDVYCLLGLEEVQLFMRKPTYVERKKQQAR
jgi:hypothetical protein